jgi:BirA family biotin operon repressor/biotin-[acetyl-CoA-carboxylase] ligase
MQLIKLSATDSTNAYLRRLSRREAVPDYTVVQAAHQTEGRGQPGTRWVGEEGKNLTFSVLKNFESFSATRHFQLNMLVSLCVYRLLESLQIPELCLKWPNDILSGTNKACGILLENQLRGAELSSSIIGIGLNVNQTEFKGLPTATSLKKVSGKSYDLSEVLMTFTGMLQEAFNQMPNTSYATYLRQYEEKLYLKDQPAPFGLPDGHPFIGTIRGVDPNGNLQVELKNGVLRTFGFKEVRYLREGD